MNVKLEIQLERTIIFSFLFNAIKQQQKQNSK